VTPNGMFLVWKVSGHTRWWINKWLNRWEQHFRNIVN